MNGILLIDKPILYTSHDIVDEVRWKLGLRRVGHAGSLDPMATGLLLVMVGPSTSLFGTLSVQDKSYEGVMTLGIKSRTQDAEGEITDEQDSEKVTEENLSRVFQQFTGVIEQQTPQYSSARIGGKKAYQLARKRVEFQAPIKEVEIKELELRAYAKPDVYFASTVSKGTYLRALAHETGEALGVGAILSGLRRTRSGCFSLKDSWPLKEFKAMPVKTIMIQAQKNLKRLEDASVLKPAG